MERFGGEVSLVDVAKMKGEEQNEVLDVLMNAINEDTELFFKRVEEIFDKSIPGWRHYRIIVISI